MLVEVVLQGVPTATHTHHHVIPQDLEQEKRSCDLYAFPIHGLSKGDMVFL